MPGTNGKHKDRAFGATGVASNLGVDAGGEDLPPGCAPENREIKSETPREISGGKNPGEPVSLGQAWVSQVMGVSGPELSVMGGGALTGVQ